MGRKSVIETHPQYEQILLDILAGELSQNDIARKYSISQSAISKYARQLPRRTEQLPKVASTVERVKKTLTEEIDQHLAEIDAFLEANRNGPPQIVINIMELRRKSLALQADIERRASGGNGTTVNIYQQNNYQQNVVTLDVIAEHLRGRANDRAAIIDILEASATGAADRPALPAESGSMGTRSTGH